MMGNLCGVISQTGRGDEVIVGDLAHLYQNEVGGYAVFGGLHVRTVPNRTACPDVEDLASAIRPKGYNFPRTGLIAIENTHNWLSGAVVTSAETLAVAEVARAAGVPIHLDGARIFNASAALGVDVRTLTEPVTTVQFCFSKGLAAPVGSILCGPKDTIAKARKVRKMLGGAMRQAGVIAAACIVALLKMRDRLVEDHINARALADGLADIPGVVIEPGRVATNIVAFALAPGISGERFRDGCLTRGLRISSYGGNWRKLRMVTHFGLDRSDVDVALSVISAVMSEVGRPAAIPAR